MSKLTFRMGGLGTEFLIVFFPGYVGSEPVLGECLGAALPNDMMKSMNQFPSLGLNHRFRVDPDRPNEMNAADSGACPGPLCALILGDKCSKCPC